MMKKKMEATIVYRGYMGGYDWDNGKQNGNCHNGFYRDYRLVASGLDRTANSY